MSRFQSKKSVIDDIGHKNDQMDIPEPLRRSSGGDLSKLSDNLDGKSDHFKKWKNEVAAHNPFLKHGFATKATEYEIEDEVLDSEEVDPNSEQGQEILSLMGQSTDTVYDPERQDAWQSDEEDMGEAPIQDSFHSQFIDRCQIDNTIKKLGTDTPREEIIEESLFKMQKYHNSAEYSPEFDMDKAIDDGLLLIESRKKKNNTEMKFIRDNSN
jgi:hypothetical protein